MAVQGHFKATLSATATKHHHPHISHLPVSMAVVFLCISTIIAAIITHPDRGVLAQPCFPQGDFNLLPTRWYYQDFDLAQSQDCDTQLPVTLVRQKDFWYPPFRWQPCAKAYWNQAVLCFFILLCFKSQVQRWGLSAGGCSPSHFAFPGITAQKSVTQ